MARPQKNSCDYFPHDNDMRNHRKVKSLRNKFGIQGYAIWCMLIEYLTGIDGNEFEYSDIEIELMSGDFGVSVTEIQDVIDYCIRLQMLFLIDGKVYSESLNERLAPVYQKRGKSKEISEKLKRDSGKYSNNTVGTVVSVTETPQSKVKESKEEKIKEEESKLNNLSSVNNAENFLSKIPATHMKGITNYSVKTETQTPNPPVPAAPPPSEFDFQVVWELYDKKIGDRLRCEKKWNSLSDKDKRAILKHIPQYVNSTPDKKYRANLETYLNQKRWSNEIITQADGKPRNIPNTTASAKPQLEKPRLIGGDPIRKNIFGKEEKSG